jgi:hypothetical protein
MYLTKVFKKKRIDKKFIRHVHIFLRFHNLFLVSVISNNSWRANYSVLNKSLLLVYDISYFLPSECIEEESHCSDQVTGLVIMSECREKRTNYTCEYTDTMDHISGKKEKNYTENPYIR